MAELIQTEIPYSKYDKSKGFTCDCCGSFVKQYRRKLNSSMSLVLLLLYKSGKREFIHIENWLKEIGRPELRADFAKLRFWDLLEKKLEDRADGSNRNGYYRLTGRGIMYVENKLTVKEKVVVYNNTPNGFEGKEIGISESLGSKFNYAELMSE